METKPDVIVISARHEQAVPAHRANVRVTVEGASLVTGRAALTKAKEISKLVSELESCGINPDDFGLESIRAEVSSGLLGRSSSATYHLRIDCHDLDQLPEVLGVITAAKNAKLRGIEWKYPDTVEQQAQWLQACIADANLKAKSAAAALGARIVGVHHLTETVLPEPAPRSFAPGALADFEVVASGKRKGAVNLGFDLGHEKLAGAAVTVTYRVETSPDA